MGLNGQTPAEGCGIKMEGENKWITLIQHSMKDKLPQMTQIVHKPRDPRKDANDPIDIVENRIKKAQRYTSESKLYESLQSQVGHTEFKRILRYLEMSNKIMFDKDNSIVWIYADNPTAKKSLEQSVSLD